VVTMESQTVISSTLSEMRDQMTRITQVLEQLSARMNAPVQPSTSLSTTNPHSYRSQSPPVQRELFRSTRSSDMVKVPASGSVSSGSKASVHSNASSTRVPSPQKKKQRPVCPVDQNFLSSNNAHDSQMMEDVDTQASTLTEAPTNTQNSHPPTAQYNNNGESAGWQPE
jgi:hypothetical protein